MIYTGMMPDCLYSEAKAFDCPKCGTALLYNKSYRCPRCKARYIQSMLKQSKLYPELTKAEKRRMDAIGYK
jgi:DNA-directed RNA polymerase subunit RPC12/RpoP